MIERTLVLVKPDGVKRGLIGDIISRFEHAGLKVVGMKMQHADEKMAKEHYSDIAERKGPDVAGKLVKLLKSGPVVAFVIEGLHAIEIVRKMVGETQPLKAAPGTIRGDFSTHSYAFADAKDLAVLNIVHASSDAKDAKREIALWFKASELFVYKNVHELVLLGEQ